MKVKTADLIGPALDYAALLAQGMSETDLASLVQDVVEDPSRRRLKNSPSTDWSRGGPLIEREEIGLRRNAPCSRGREWEASPSITAKGAGGKWGYGPTPLVAACRCLVASVLGDEVEIPDELV